jgi:hypothetical protein
MTTNPNWDPKIAFLTLFSTLVGLEYGEEKKRIRNPDIQLFNEFIKTLPSNGDIEYLRTENMGGWIDSTKLLQIKRFLYEWNTAEHEFLDRGLEKKRKVIYKSIDDFLNYYGAHAFNVKDQFYRIYPDLLGTDPEKVRITAEKLDLLATKIYNSHQAFVRVARRKLKVQE